MQIKSFKDWKKAVNKKEQEIKGGVLEVCPRRKRVLVRPERRVMGRERVVEEKREGAEEMRRLGD